MDKDGLVAVIGGGAAGIAAARRLHDAGVPVRLLEARDRLGGRAWTVTTMGGFSVDLGCGWLHSADRNPWVEIVRRAGLAIDETPAPWSRPAIDAGFSRREQEDYAAAMAAFYERLALAADAGPDGPASELLSAGSRWNALLDATSTYINGVELDALSVHDFARYHDSGTNWRVVGGYGAAIAGHAEGLDVRLGCAVTAINHTGDALVLETTLGPLTAAAAIVTLPPGLLAAEAIRFTPALPEKLEAAAGLPLGVADKAYLELLEPEAFAPESRAMGRIDRRDTGAYHFRPLGAPLVEGYFGGRFAVELEGEGDGAFAAFATDELVDLFGSDMRKRLRPLAASAWHRDPLARGSYSHALPGHADDRAVLAASVGGRLFFAGEACSAHDFSTAHGAYETGVAAADEVLAARAAPRKRRSG